MFADYYRQLGEADMPFAKQCMTHWRRFLMGPPNRPNEDIYGLLDVSVFYIFLLKETSVKCFGSNSYGFFFCMSKIIWIGNTLFLLIHY
jgi:hypothetical protein